MFKHFTALSLCTLPLTCTETSWAEKTLASLSRAEKIGQLIAMRVEMTDDIHDVNAKITQCKIGCVIPLDHHVTHAPWKLKEHCALIQNLQNLYPTPLSSPILVIEDAEWGCAMCIQELTPFPRALTLGAVSPKDRWLVYVVGSAIGAQCRALGIHLNCAPVVDVNSDYNNPIIGMRSFGDNPDTVSACAVAYIRGIQDAGIIPCIKHFPGHGNTSTDSHMQLPIIKSDKKYIEEHDLAPFIHCLQHTNPAVMVGHLAVPALEQNDIEIIPATLSPAITQRYLQNAVGFKGLVISDALDMHALTSYGKTGEIALKTLKAGIDLLLCPPDIDAVVTRITHALETGEYTEKELDVHVLKILQVKEALGLHEQKRQRPALEFYEDLIQDAYDAAATACNNFAAPHDVTQYAPVTLGSPRTAQIPTYDPAQTHTKPLLIHLYPGSYRTHRLTPEQTATLTQIATTSPKSIVLLFGSPYCLMDIPNTLATLVLYEDTSYTRNTAEKVINGALTPQGTLPISLS